MSAKNEVTHTGIVKSVGSYGITVGVVVQSGCASCQIKGACNMAEQADKELEINCDPAGFKIGQQVKVFLKTSQGMNALFLGYVLPFLVLLGVMIILSNIIEDEGLVGIFSLLSLAPYYLVLFLFRKQIKKKFTYVVKPLNDSL
ncbi:MAG: SoxR reducing system RseC family protein [Prolixibacteraceae bacterium]|nr:SoxR reducing system RseC family protein [Prolixibacteraceae bacterium]MBN2649808.1 SoxR reducing system RseC family protein [Prolixibacteraceae bacterium]